MHCPKCVEVSLVERQVHETDVRVDTCKRCGGIWFDADEMEHVLDVASKGLFTPRDADDTGMTCPRCYVPLKAFDYPQTEIEIDMCPECHGLWLDRGEFQKIRDERQQLDGRGELEEYAPVPGIKGNLIRKINSIISEVTSFD